MPRDAPAIAQPSELLRALRDPNSDLRQKYLSDPVALAESFHLKLPPKPVQVMLERGIITLEDAVERFGPFALEPGLRELIEDVCLGTITSAAAVANRGGGKSLGVSFIEFFLVFLKLFDALNLGGSELQADQVYQYLISYIDSNPYWQKLVKGEPMRERTYTVDEAWIRVLTASQKSVRSPHAGGRKKSGRMAGGLLVIDEEAEASADIVEAALPTINTARPSVNVRCSTFHNAEGSFADLMDNYKEMGYKLYRWDIFDVCEPCDCPVAGQCASAEKCFASDHFEPFTDPETGEQREKLVHRAYCGGRAQFADGWIPMEEVEKLWMRMKRNHSRWEVEAMGSRPSTSGHVIKDLQAFSKNLTPASPSSLYVPGYPVSITVDWGTAAAGVEVWQEQAGDTHVLLHADLVEEAGQTQIIGIILGYYQMYYREVMEVAADIGGGGNYLNPLLREEHNVNVRDVNFAEEKEAAVAAWNIFNEANKTIIPAEFTAFAGQVRNWKRKKDSGRIEKKDDHLCDAAICYFSKFIERLGLVNVRIAPRAWSPDAGTASHHAPFRGSDRTVVRRPIVRTLSSGRKRRT